MGDREAKKGRDDCSPRGVDWTKDKCCFFPGVGLVFFQPDLYTCILDFFYFPRKAKEGM